MRAIAVALGAVAVGLAAAGCGASAATSSPSPAATSAPAAEPTTGYPGMNGPGGAKNGAPAPAYTPPATATLSWTCSIVATGNGPEDAEVMAVNSGSTPVTVATVTYRAYASQTYRTETLPGSTVQPGGTLDLRQQVSGSYEAADLIPQSCAVTGWTT
jgi:hypothetical protein